MEIAEARNEGNSAEGPANEPWNEIRMLEK
jgi:hypothetical protein